MSRGKHRLRSKAWPKPTQQLTVASLVAIATGDPALLPLLALKRRQSNQRGTA